jgi:hypothetical protein
MSLMNQVQKFFQNEKKFVVGKTYETIRVQTPPWKPHNGSYLHNLETCDEIGTIIPNSELFLGKYVSSQCYGYGDNGGRYDNFINNKGQEISHYLDYDGTTRYREVKSDMDERINYLKLIESTGGIKNVDGTNEHINKFILNKEVLKEICSFMNPLL